MWAHIMHTDTHTHTHKCACASVPVYVCSSSACWRGHSSTGDTAGLQTSVSRQSSPLKGTHAFWPLPRVGAEKGQRKDEPRSSMLDSSAVFRARGDIPPGPRPPEGTYPQTQAFWGAPGPPEGAPPGRGPPEGLPRTQASWRVSSGHIGTVSALRWTRVVTDDNPANEMGFSKSAWI